MCRRYTIVYRSCKAKSDLSIQPPWCTPVKSQVREYVNSQGWQICDDSENEVPCDQTAQPHIEYTFVEPYCSDACEEYHEGPMENANTRTKNRLLYLDGPTINGYRNLPQSANLGNVAVDFERVMLVYHGLLDFVDRLTPESKLDDVEFDFPITQSFVARATALFLIGPLSSMRDEIIYDFPDLAIEDQVHILQRTMAAMSITSELSTHSCFLRHSLDKGKTSRDRWIRRYLYYNIFVDGNFTTGRYLRTFSAQENLMSRMSETEDQTNQWNSYKEYIEYDRFSEPAVCFDTHPFTYILTNDLSSLCQSHSQSHSRKMTE